MDRSYLFFSGRSPTKQIHRIASRYGPLISLRSGKSFYKNNILLDMGCSYLFLGKASHKINIIQ